MYILVLVKRYNIYIYEMVIVVPICVDNILLKMVVLTETCKGWKIKNTTFINRTRRRLKILYTLNISCEYNVYDNTMYEKHGAV
jgi:hypothetical protein